MFDCKYVGVSRSVKYACFFSICAVSVQRLAPARTKWYFSITCYVQVSVHTRQHVFIIQRR